jgi:hypothetical protein
VCRKVMRSVPWDFYTEQALRLIKACVNHLGQR